MELICELDVKCWGEKKSITEKGRLWKRPAVPSVDTNLQLTECSVHFARDSVNDSIAV